MARRVLSRYRVRGSFGDCWAAMAFGGTVMGLRAIRASGMRARATYLAVWTLLALPMPIDLWIGYFRQPGSESARNTLQNPTAISPKEAPITLQDHTLTLTLPPLSAAAITLTTK